MENMYKPLEIFSDLSERLTYNVSDFPLCVYKGSLRFYDTNSFAYHWHTDLEFVLILEGTMTYFVNGQTVEVDSGQAIFVNSKRLHRGASFGSGNCSYIVVTVHPSLLGEGSLAGKAYLDEKFGLNAEDFLLLSPRVDWQREAIELLVGIYDQLQRNPDNLLHLLSRSADLCARMADHIREYSAQYTDTNQLAIIHEMTGYIHRHYDSRLTIDEIAAAGSVCRSRCCELFKKHIRLTPNNYLTQYRIQKSCEMLKDTNRPVSEIAIACGFQTASYFSHVFHKQIARTPQEFRKEASDSVS
ncbi:AraC family transcriptional regulator [Saccharibacillus sp. CPCC 101409]|uniref:helix-turn-helix domain-containing protein n=1 Tax=Saccharibacillus sp. CPCC 101409 TaxID=3058041 RepID=UPI0026739EA3|nr:AraC family transcriptional regulator [Saccharibacillus sp. CPCC 101409]MDO3411740.1 AraC family transcriptional regulator [Saccharibacillus sp. CPCC 101409]